MPYKKCPMGYILRKVIRQKQESVKLNFIKSESI